MTALLARLLRTAPPVLGKYAQIGMPPLPEVSAALRPTSSSVHGQSENLDSVLTHVRGLGVRRFSFGFLRPIVPLRDVCDPEGERASGAMS